VGSILGGMSRQGRDYRIVMPGLDSAGTSFVNNYY